MYASTYTHSSYEHLKSCLSTFAEICMYAYTQREYAYTYVCVCICIYTHTHIADQPHLNVQSLEKVLANRIHVHVAMKCTNKQPEGRPRGEENGQQSLKMHTYRTIIWRLAHLAP